MYSRKAIRDKFTLATYTNSPIRPRSGHPQDLNCPQQVSSQLEEWYKYTLLQCLMQHDSHRKPSNPRGQYRCQSEEFSMLFFHDSSSFLTIKINDFKSTSSNFLQGKRQCNTDCVKHGQRPSCDVLFKQLWNVIVASVLWIEMGKHCNCIES